MEAYNFDSTTISSMKLKYLQHYKQFFLLLVALKSN